MTWDEFLVMYQRCISDKTGLEPRNLFNLVQFMMYDKDNIGRISVENTLQILFVRHGRQHLDEEIQEIFGVEQGQQVGDQTANEKRITFSELEKKMTSKRSKSRPKTVLLPKIHLKSTSNFSASNCILILI